MANRRSRNKVILMGNATKDFSYLPNSDSVVAFSLATNETWRDKKTQKLMEKTEYHNCVAFGKSAEYLVKYARKGSLIDVEGKLRTRKWQDQSGNDRYSTEIACDEVQIIDGWKQNELNDQVPDGFASSQAVPQGGSNPAMNMPQASHSDAVPEFQS